MKIPITFVAGFLESGKTSYIHSYLASKEYRQGYRILLVSYEAGISEYHIPQSQKTYIKIDSFSSLSDTSASYFENASYLYDEIIIEYNGTWKFAEFMKKCLTKNVFIQRVICMINTSTFAMYIKNMDTIAEHIMNANIMILTNVQRSKEVKEIRKCIHQLQPAARIHILNKDGIVEEEKVMNINKFRSYAMYLITFVILAVLIYLLQTQQIQISDITNFYRMFFSIVLQAIPFLLVGIVFSSILQIYVSDERIVRFITKHQVLALPFLILSGCILPLCDCAMVPVTEKFIQKGISVPLAMVFFCISSSINPIVIVSTYYAFPEHSMYVWIRLLLSIVVALCIGLSFYVYGIKDKGSLLKASSLYLQKSYDYDIQQCMKKGKMGTFTAFGIHISNEFFRILVYIFLGALLSTIVQLAHTNFPSFAALSATTGFSFLYTLFATVFLSICASSNAFIAKGFTNTMAVSSVFPFMIFGPLLDIKNLLILSSRFNKRFIIVYIGTLIFLFFCAAMLLRFIL